MPTYDYKCTTCGRIFEVMQSMTAPKLEKCPPETCEQEPKGEGSVERKIGAGSAPIFNGEGFYETDYVKKRQK